jgi:phosphatidylserine decarboxylase
MSILRFIPFNYISWFVGLLINAPVPAPLARLSILVFAWLYGINTDNATRPLSSFKSIGEFFTRDLKAELRPTGEAPVFPVDGTLRGVANLDRGGVIPQVKGKDYTLSDLLGGDPLVARFASGQVWNMYLSPSDAHHIFAPVAGEITRTTWIPGALWPVNDWALNSVERLFAVNERVVTYIESELGLFAVVMVGATNVGKISLNYTQLETNLRPWARPAKTTIEHTPTVKVNCGDKIGTFKMGSSVILVCERPIDTAAETLRSIKITYGSSIR